MKIRGTAAILASLCAAFSLFAAPKKNEPADAHSELQAGGVRRMTAASYGPERTTPVRKGEFHVALVVIAFPDCVAPESADAVLKSLSNLEGGTVTDYFKDYSQGITWPVLEVYPTVYMAPEPLGYYCRGDPFKNPPGFGNDGEARAQKLRADATRFAQSKGKVPNKPDYICCVYCTSLNKDPDLMERLIRRYYRKKPTPAELARGVIDYLTWYDPKVHWADPLWPNSIPQVTYPGNGRTLVHEIGHILGAPDYYHATEEHDGVEGTPALPWSYGPTGPAYCRYIYNAFVPAEAYPKLTAACDVKLSPRSSRFPAAAKKDAAPAVPPLGVFVPSAHPNYIFCIEYCKDEKLPVGNPSARGLLVHVVNVTMTSPMMGPPDLSYTYRSGDPDFKGIGEAGRYFRPGDVFDEKSDPAALLPNFLPAGIAISNIVENADGTCSFRLETPPVKLTKSELDFALLPQTRLVKLDGGMPTSLHATMDVRYRGEPLLSEYGFCWGTRKNPTEKSGTLFPLHHRDRYDARITGLVPGVKYFIRAYARNANGIRYSPDEAEFTLRDEDSKKPFKGTLFSESDALLSNWYYQRWHFGVGSDNCYNSANPIFALMAMANYYRLEPGAQPSDFKAAKSGNKSRRKPMATAPRAKKSDDATAMEYVHCNPSESRPKFRMTETEKLYVAMKKLVVEAGFAQPDFEWDGSGSGDGDSKKQKKPSSPRAPGKKGSSGGSSYGDHGAWVAKCAAALKIKNPQDVFFACRTEDEINRLAPKIREWILMSQPVMVVRQNRPMSDDESVRWPLDIAIIDGFGFDETTYNVVFPGGSDRGRKGLSSVKTLGEILERTSDAIVMFYRP